MRVALFHDDVAADAPLDQRDVLVQMEAIEASLQRLGHESTRVPCTGDLVATRAAVGASRADVVFNLVESIGGQGRLIALAPLLLESIGLPFTGCAAAATFLSSGKLEAKRVLASAGVPTPASFTLDQLRQGCDVPAGEFILKSAWEHASIGLDDDAVVKAENSAQLAAALSRRLPLLAGEGFAEAFVEGREFNVSLLCGTVLPIAEIEFEKYPAGKPRIVGYAAKWEEGTREYHATPRRFPTGREDADLLGQLSLISQTCWKAFGLDGYARVDFRVDGSGKAWVLEINSNPCLSPDAGFAAAIDRAGMTYTEAIATILADAIGPRHA